MLEHVFYGMELPFSAPHISLLKTHLIQNYKATISLMSLESSALQVNYDSEHSVHWGINPHRPSKTPPPSFLPSPPLNLQIVHAPSF